MQGSSSWFRSHGFHRLLREAHSHSNVCIFPMVIRHVDHPRLRNNILVYVVPAFLLGSTLPILTAEVHDHFTLRPNQPFTVFRELFDLIYISYNLPGKKSSLESLEHFCPT